MNSDAKIFLFPAAPPESSQNSQLAEAMGPHEARMRARLAKMVGCSYSDSFDWSIYDRLAKRFASTPPHGETPFKISFKLANYHASCTKCDCAFALDTYGRGCVHNCLYCYAREQLSAHGYWKNPTPFPIDLTEVRKVFYTVFETQKPSPWRKVMEKRIPLRLGSMSDSFMWVDRKYKVTQEMLRILSHYNYPYIVFTRSDLIAQDDYLKLLRPDLAAVQMSMSGGDEKLTQALEPGAPSVKRRLEASTKLVRSGILTTARLNPFFPTHPDGYYTDPLSIGRRFGSRAACPTFNVFSWDFLEVLKQAEIPSVLAGFVRLTTVALKQVSQETGVDLKSFFTEDVQASRADKVYSDPEIAYYYQKIAERCRQLGMRFTTCYIGNGLKDFTKYQGLWSNRQDCCDLKSNVAGFTASSQIIPWPKRLAHAQNRPAAERARQTDQDVPS